MDLNTILIILGVIALVALIGHGIWSNHREKSKIFNNENAFKSQNKAQIQSEEQKSHSVQNTETQPKAVQTHNPQPVKTEVKSSSPTLDHQVASEQRVEDIKISIPSFEPKDQQSSQLTAKEDLAQPNFATMTLEQLEQNSDEIEGINSSSPEIRQQLAELAQGESASYSATDEIEKQTSGYIMLYIVAPEGVEFSGHRLDQVLDSLGFRFGKQDIYHRHLDLTVSSPVLFSIANIQQPGTFDHYRMTEFSTLGITLFMQLPSVGNNLANLKMMIQIAKTLADELGGFILTDQQQLFDSQAEQHYLAKVA